MDYSKKGIENKQNYIKSTTRRLTSKLRITLFRLLLCGGRDCYYRRICRLGYIKGLIDSALIFHRLMLFPEDIPLMFMTARVMLLNT